MTFLRSIANTLGAALAHGRLLAGEQEARAETDTAGERLRFLAEAITWNFWPKMLPAAPDGPAMTFGVELDGEPIEVRRPEQLPPLGALSCPPHAGGVGLLEKAPAEVRPGLSWPSI